MNTPTVSTTVAQNVTYIIPPTPVITVASPQLATCSLPNQLLLVNNNTYPTTLGSSAIPQIATYTTGVNLNPNPVLNFSQANCVGNGLVPMSAQTQIITMQQPTVQVLNYNTLGITKPSPKSGSQNNQRRILPNKTVASDLKIRLNLIKCSKKVFSSNNPPEKPTIGSLNAKEVGNSNVNQANSNSTVPIVNGPPQNPTIGGLKPTESGNLNVMEANENRNSTVPVVSGPPQNPTIGGLNPTERENLNVIKGNENHSYNMPILSGPFQNPTIDGLIPTERENLNVIKGNDMPILSSPPQKPTIGSLNPTEHDSLSQLTTSTFSTPLTESTNGHKSNSTTSSKGGNTSEENVKKSSVSLPEYEAAFIVWCRWLERWGNLKAPEVYDEIRFKDDFYICMRPDCTYSTMNCEDFREHLLASHHARFYTCSYCLAKFKGMELLFKHMQKHWACSLQCPLCVYRASSPAHITMHWQMLHSKNELEKIWNCGWSQAREKPNQITSYYVAPYRCTECSFKTKTLIDFGLHQAVHPSLFCFVCKASMSSFNYLLIHLREHRINDFHCAFCKFAAGSRETVYHHICLTHPEKDLVLFSRVEVEDRQNGLSFKDRLPESQLTESENLENNLSNTSSYPMDTHKTNNENLSLMNSDKRTEVLISNADNTESPLVFTCIRCKEQFGSKEEISLHLKFEHCKFNVKFCSKCTKYFMTQKMLEKHLMRYHSSNAAMYLCVFCNFFTPNYADMANHLYKKICGEGKENADAAKQNGTKNVEVEKWINGYLKAQDSGVPLGFKKLKPTKLSKTKLKQKNRCPMCSRFFQYATQKVVHICTHLCYKPYSCCYCDKGFYSHTCATKHALEAHNQTVRPFKCFPTAFIDNWIKKLVYGDDPLKWPSIWCFLCNFNNRDVSLVLKHFEKQHPNEALSISNPLFANPNKTSISLELANVEQFEGPQLGDATSALSVVHDEQGSSAKDDLVLNSAELVHTDSSVPTETQSHRSDVEQPFESHLLSESQKTASETTKRSKNDSSFMSRKSFPREVSPDSNAQLNTSDCSETDMDSSDSTSVNLKCSICSFSASDLNVFKDHCKSKHSMKGYHRKRIRCNTSSKPKIPKISTLDNSSKKQSLGSPDEITLAKCPLCKYSTSSAQSLSSHIKKTHQSGSRRIVRPLSSDDDEDEVETVLHVKDKSTLSNQNCAGSSKSTKDHTSANRKQPLCNVSSGDKVGQSCELNYKSNYGLKPAPVDLKRMFVAVRNPGGCAIRVALEYYKDVWFRREIRVILKDCIKSAL